MIHEGHEGSRSVKRKFVAFVCFVDSEKTQLMPVCSIEAIIHDQSQAHAKSFIKLALPEAPKEFWLIKSILSVATASQQAIFSACR
jgi:hypothetical protein